jgi:integrase
VTHSKKSEAARKPHPDFPLSIHKGTGRWYKKVRGKLHYFGYLAKDPKGDAALVEWLRVKDDLLAGRVARPKASGVTVRDLANRFTNQKLAALNAGEIGQRTYDEYFATCAMVVKKFGRDRGAEDLQPADFDALRATMAKRWGPVRLGNEIQRVRSIFRDADELIGRPIRFGKAFKKPSAKVVRIARAQKGPTDYTAEQLTALIDAAGTTMKAMILLGINGGLGNTDLGQLRIESLDLDGGWLNYPRPKTGVARAIPLWPETVAAIRDVLAKRREPKDKKHAGLLFISPRGHSYVVKDRTYGLTAEFIRLSKTVKITGRTFYDLRRTFQTVAEGSYDMAAVQSIMGHAPRTNDMSAVYRQRIQPSRLRLVADHVRGWLYADQKNSIKSAG